MNRQHPYRDGIACDLCGSAASETCPRCGVTLCTGHALAPEERCPHCEQAFTAHWRRRMGLWLCFLIPFPLVVLALLDAAMQLGLLASLADLWRGAVDYAPMLHGYGSSYLCGLIVWSALAVLVWAAAVRYLVELLGRSWRRVFLAEAL